MSKSFNLFSLHKSSDRHPRSWICVQGNTLVDTVSQLEKEILGTHKISRERLSRLLSQELHCSRGVIKKILRGGTPFYPIVVLQKLLARSSRQQAFYRRIKKNISALKVNSASAKPVNAVYTLSKDLAKIIGAFAADGSLSVQLILAASTRQPLEKLQAAMRKIIPPTKIQWSSSRKQHYLAIQLNEYSRNVLNHFEKFANYNLLTQTHYVIELTDEYEDNVRAFSKWMETIFEIQPSFLNIKRGKRAWRVIFSNKILARYLTEFFGMRSGLKTYDVAEPERIKVSALDIRRDFAKGVLMFDGCVTKGGKITFSSKSKDLASAIEEIWTKDRITHGILSMNKRSEYTVGTTIPNSTERLLKYFEPNTQKWKLLRWINGDKAAKPVIKDSVALSAEKILLLLKKIRSCDINFLERYFERNHTSIRHYLRILKSQGYIRISTSPHTWSRYISDKTTVYLSRPTHNMIFAKIKEKLNLEKNAASVLGIHNATFSAWKLRKNRIPVEILQQLCSLLGLNFSDLIRNVIQADRNILELI